MKLMKVSGRRVVVFGKLDNKRIIPLDVLMWVFIAIVSLVGVVGFGALCDSIVMPVVALSVEAVSVGVALYIMYKWERR